jgi:hypothetical protein
MTYMRPAEWLSSNRYMQTSGGPPRFYTFMQDPKNRGRMCLRIYPPPDTFQTIDFIYRRKPRDINVWSQSTGKASTSIGTTGVTLSGGGVFTALNVGSIIRFSADAQLPTGSEGLNPYYVEREIVEVSSTTTATMDDTVDVSLAEVGYVMSDPVDVEPQSSFNCMFAAAIKFLCFSRNRKEYSDAVTNWRFALDLAKEADMRNTSRDGASLWGPFRQRLRDMPRAPDIS